MSIKVPSLMERDMMVSLWASYMRSLEAQLASCRRLGLNGGLFTSTTPDADPVTPTFAKPLAPLPEWLKKVDEITKEEGKG